MIEIAFDENFENTYNGKSYPVIDVPLLGDNFAHYQDFALKTIRRHTSERYLIFKADDSKFSYLKLAFALFIASSLNETALDCAVFKVPNKTEAFEAYKPFIAASIAITYALRLSKMPAFNVYKELKCLNYLNFSLKESYADKSIIYTMSCPDELVQNIETHNVFDAIVNVGVLKALSLAQMPKNIYLKVYITNTDELISQDMMVNAIINKLSNILSFI